MLDVAFQLYVQYLGNHECCILWSPMMGQNMVSHHVQELDYCMYDFFPELHLRRAPSRNGMDSKHYKFHPLSTRMQKFAIIMYNGSIPTNDFMNSVVNVKF